MKQPADCQMHTGDMRKSPCVSSCRLLSMAGFGQPAANPSSQNILGQRALSEPLNLKALLPRMAALARSS